MVLLMASPDQVKTWIFQFQLLSDSVRQSLDLSDKAADDIAMLVYSIIWTIGYSILAIFSFILGFPKIFLKKPSSLKGRLSLICVFVFACLRTSKYILRATNSFDPTGVFSGLFFIFPTGFLCTCYSLIVFHWAQVLSRTFDSIRLLRVFQIFLYGVNAILYLGLLSCGCVSIYLATLGAQGSLSRHMVYGVEDLVISVFDVFTGIGFLIFGIKLWRINRSVSLSPAMRSTIKQVSLIIILSTVCLVTQTVFYLFDAFYLLTTGKFPTGDDNISDPFWILYMHRLIEYLPAVLLMVVTSSRSGSLMGAGTAAPKRLVERDADTAGMGAPDMVYGAGEAQTDYVGYSLHTVTNVSASAGVLGLAGETTGVEMSSAQQAPPLSQFFAGDGSSRAPEARQPLLDQQQ
ncbi:hypothetical protein PAPYR_1406 [Paratrimastix pyriformis]|uniref:THH1/TOM1/TOM3 domain-containing protein n=1 Tax=Paratrimastix pyriformis TaxID=342808 RepID=A0ABQ8UTQ4_9EUKA|nr:hypothetical protein PAPYR_1406 [Paratrimastix pyriformis]